MIACKEITQTFKEVTALHNVSVNFEKGKNYGVAGGATVRENPHYSILFLIALFPRREK